MDIHWWSNTSPTELILLLLAFALSAVIGYERGRKLKSAGLRTHTLVGVGAAVFTLVSAYGFAGISGPDANLDPSRIAAQIVSGVGFLGAGVIFVRGGAVSGLTTAASIWVTASVGMACGAGMPLLAAGTTALHLLTVTVLGRLHHRGVTEAVESEIQVRYRDGQGVLRRALALAHNLGVDATVTQTRVVGKSSKLRHESTISLIDSSRTSLDTLLDGWSAIDGMIRVQQVRQPDDEL